MITFDPHITLDGIAMVTAVCGGVGAVLRYFVAHGRRFDRMTMTIKEHGAKIDKLSSIVELQTRHDERITAQGQRLVLLETEIADLRRGKGFITD